LIGAVVYMQPRYSAIAFWRFVDPFGQHTWTQISVARSAPADLMEAGDEWEGLDPSGRKKDRIAIGRPYFIRVQLSGQIPKQARVEIDGNIRTDKLIKLEDEKGNPRDWFVTPIEMTQYDQTFKFRILANDGRFPPRGDQWHEVRVMPPPKLVPLDGKASPQIVIYPPAYTDLPPKALDPGVKHLDVYAGSTVVLRAKADRPLKQAWIESRPENALRFRPPRRPREATPFGAAFPPSSKTTARFFRSRSCRSSPAATRCTCATRIGWRN
jgi:hypothetical protein